LVGQNVSSNCLEIVHFEKRGLLSQRVTDIVHGDQVIVPVTNWREFLCTQHNDSGYVEK
jgi:hypothetical protein